MRQKRMASLGWRRPTVDRDAHFFSSGFVGAVPVVGFVSVGFTVGAVAPGFGVVVSVVSSELQPVMKTSARTKLDSIVQVLIPDFSITNALLEKHETRQGIPS
jgi:hypothetical protein